ncbi:hypothetical protein D3C78_1846440 [compost metagenome]
MADGLATQRGIGAADVDELVAFHPLDGIKAVILDVPALLLNQVANLRPIAEQQLQALALLHL